MKNLILLAGVLALAGCEKIIAPADPLHEAARRTCKDNIESRAVNRNTVTYLSTNATHPVTKTPKGELDFSIRFSVRNEIGSPSTLLAHCVVSADGKKLVGITVKDTR